MTTTIDCPNCGLQYPIPDLGAIRGRKVRCRSCAHVWRVDVAGTAAALPAERSLPSQGGIDGVMNRDPGKPEAPPTLADASRTVALGMPHKMSPEAAWAVQEGAKAVAKPAADYPANGARAVGPAPAQPTPLVTERRRVGRRHSTFDDVEAAIAALQSNVAQASQGAAPVAPAALEPAAGHASKADFPLLSDTAGTLEDSPFAQDEFAEPPPSERVGPVLAWGAFLGLCAGLCFFAYTGRATVVRTLPGAAAVYAALGLPPVNTRGLEFSDIDFHWQKGAEGRPELSLTGQIRNVSDDTRAVPTVVVAFLDDQGRELFDWATPVHMTSLPSGQTMPFTTIVPAPPDAVRNVEFRFAKLVH